MLGAIAGDIIGSAYEFEGLKTTGFELFPEEATFTDDSVLTFAVAHAILDGGDYGGAIRSFAKKYPNRGYGGRFRTWIASGDTQPYNSFGNGSAMRVSPVGFAFDTEAEVLAEAKRSADCSHNHPEGVKGAQATALAIFMARKGAGKEDIRKRLAVEFSYDLGRTVKEIRPEYRFDETCQGSVPEALIAFFDSQDYEDAVRLAVSLGGDGDTQACIAGGVAEAFHGGVPEQITEEALERLPVELRSLLGRFSQKFSKNPA